MVFKSILGNLSVLAFLGLPKVKYNAQLIKMQLSMLSNIKF